jgi:hypothetical protein
LTFKLVRAVAHDSAAARAHASLRLSRTHATRRTGHSMARAAQPLTHPLLWWPFVHTAVHSPMSNLSMLVCRSLRR